MLSFSVRAVQLQILNLRLLNSLVSMTRVSLLCVFCFECVHDLLFLEGWGCGGEVGGCLLGGGGGSGDWVPE